MFKLQSLNNRVNLLVEIDPREPMPEYEPQVPDTYASSGSSSAPATDQASDDGTQIDIMVVYSTQTLNKYGGVDGVNAHIATAIAESNDAYFRSGINTRLRLVHTAEIGDTSTSMSADLGKLQNRTDGVYDEVHTLRDAYGADMVSLFGEYTDYCGIAYLNTGDLSFDGGYGFSVADSDCAVGYYTTAHELGHNMGSHHDYDTVNPESATTIRTGVYSYSFGYQDPDALFRTVMAYNCAGGCYRIRNFSNPNVDITVNNGGSLVTRPTGTAAADNARSINQTRIDVSQWRTAVVGTPPVAAFSASCDLLTCTFTDVSTSSNAIVSRTWDFSDGTTSSAINPTHTFSSAGSYDVTLTLEDDTGALSVKTETITVVESVPVVPNPPGDFSVSPSETGTSVLLSWTASAEAEDYVVERERKHKNGRWTGLTSFTTTSTAIEDFPGEGTYQYRVFARNNVGISDAVVAGPVDVTGTTSGGGGGGTKGGKGRNK